MDLQQARSAEHDPQIIFDIPSAVARRAQEYAAQQDQDPKVTIDIPRPKRD